MFLSRHLQHYITTLVCWNRASDPSILGVRRYNYSTLNPIVSAVSPLVSHCLRPRHRWEMFPLTSPYLLSDWFMTHQHGLWGCHKRSLPLTLGGANPMSSSSPLGYDTCVYLVPSQSHCHFTFSAVRLVHDTARWVVLSHKQPFPKYWEGANLFPSQVPWAVIPVYI